MATAVADLNSLVSEIRDTLPLLRARLSKDPESTGLDATALRAELHVRQDILTHYDRINAGDLKESDVVEVLRTLHEGVQHCAQSEIDRASDPENSEEVFACLGALADLDDRLIKLGAKKPIRGERPTRAEKIANQNA